MQFTLLLQQQKMLLSLLKSFILELIDVIAFNYNDILERYESIIN